VSVWHLLRMRYFFIFAGAAAFTLSASMTAEAEIIPVADMLRGSHVTYAQCAAKPDAVWVTAYRRDFCVRYYLSAAGGDGLHPVVYLEGDKLGTYDYNTRRFERNPKDPPSSRDVDFDTDKTGRWIANFSKLTKTPAIYLARIGVDGSSGYHGARKTMLELHVMNAALHAIKRRHRFTGFHLVGQSGGSKLVGGLLALRTDIVCAVPGSGPLDAKVDRTSPDPALRYFNVSDSVTMIALNRAARVLVVTDPADQRVLAKEQTGFVHKLRRAGGRVEQFFVNASDPLHHGVSRYARLAAAECIRGAEDGEISVKLAQAAKRTPPAPRRDARDR
jgi:hypothetical protein